MKVNRLSTTLITLLLGAVLHIAPAIAASNDQLRALVTSRVAAEYPSPFGIDTNLHAHPELSFMEVKTAALVAGGKIVRESDRC